MPKKQTKKEQKSNLQFSSSVVSANFEEVFGQRLVKI